MRFKGKVAAVTGGGSGIGRQTAIRFAGEGASVAVIDINLDAAIAVRGELPGKGAAHLAVHCDVSDVEMVQGCFHTIVDTLGTLDILFNNAGIVRGPGIEDTTDLARLSAESASRRTSRRPSSSSPATRPASSSAKPSARTVG